MQTSTISNKRTTRKSTNLTSTKVNRKDLKYKSEKENQNKKSTTPYSPGKECYKKKVKTLQQKSRRRNKKMLSLKDIISVLKDKKISDKYASNIENQFSGLTNEILENGLHIVKHKQTGSRCTDEIKTLNNLH